MEDKDSWVQAHWSPLDCLIVSCSGPEVIVTTPQKNNWWRLLEFIFRIFQAHDTG